MIVLCYDKLGRGQFYSYISGEDKLRDKNPDKFKKTTT